jgi:hypothetical protein
MGMFQFIVRNLRAALLIKSKTFEFLGHANLNQQRILIKTQIADDGERERTNYPWRTISKLSNACGDKLNDRGSIDC